MFKRDWHWLIFFRPDYNENALLYQLKRCRIKIMQEDGVLAGFVAYYMQYKHSGHILFLGVNPEFRNRGFGAKLLNYALDDLKTMSAKYTTIVTRHTNAPALHLYKKIGFQEYQRTQWFSHLVYKY